ncbi:MAG: stage IV sporulation protein A [Ruminococcaceae bacterium]|nr:stage IV sporulation protein A [Oscillospiraceae bacterium]
MENIYNDIGVRCGGDIYIGVVGPVRTGKSTFIKRFMDLLVIPNINDAYKRERARDELPQSGAGKMIMTTEPKFVPNEAVNISLSDNANFNVRMIDCVGYIVDSALGHFDEEMPRMVKTPWSDEEIPFSKAAEIGTKKVITEHSTIGLLVTCDGTITDIDRKDYIEAEQRVANELKEINKPFVILVNSVNPEGEVAQKVKRELEDKYNTSAICVNCATLTKEDINKIIESVLFEFPLSEIYIDLPDWVDVLDKEHWLKKDIYSLVLDSVEDIYKIRDNKKIIEFLSQYENIENVNVDNIDLSKGQIKLNINTQDELFYRILGEKTGIDITGKESLIELVSELSEIKKKYDKISNALNEVSETGYGIVTPSIDELTLEEPEIVKQGNKFGVKLKASAPSLHLIRVDVETEVSPLVGTEKQSEELVHYLLNEFDESPTKIWESNIFGKSLHELVNEGLHNKLYRMPLDAQDKLKETLQKIVNEGSGGLICIIL